jgi:hypothetical protein
MACPPPDYPLLFGYDDIWKKSQKIEEGNVKLKIDGRMQLMSWPDRLRIKMRFEGLDTAQVVFFDTINNYGIPINITKFFDNRIIFQGEAFELYRPQVYIEKHAVDVILFAPLEIHRPYSDMNTEEFLSYLDSFNAMIRIENIFPETKIIEVRPDRKLLMKKMGKWVPALREED